VRVTDKCFGMTDVFTRDNGIKEFNMAQDNCILLVKTHIQAYLNTIRW
jgi:hypothetical protein